MKTLDGDYLRLDTRLGHIHGHIRILVKIANATKMKTVQDFNDTDLIVEPGDKETDVYRDWVMRREARISARRG